MESVHLRQRVGQTLNPRVDRWIHPLTQVVLTSLREFPNDPQAKAWFSLGKTYVVDPEKE